MRVWLAIVAGVMASPAMAADQFDLVCQSAGHVPVRYRIDLGRGEACSDSCDPIWKMGVSTSGELRITDIQPVLRGDMRQTSVVNRTTGDWRMYTEVAGKIYDWTGKCEKAPFSGFPVAKF